ncbi:tRNA uridine(34) 5-carboxymethylaminomethyl modification radical SAM/GNAT enzyme Elp3 [Patescibacteria group bacterium]|nr:tRNA uridine(34) 5-carboxymethylaminomethyl modification radical SAM/GNAT enzyme Elp3 [Patescibacteria group bacterium]
MTNEREKLVNINRAREECVARVIEGKVDNEEELAKIIRKVCGNYDVLCDNLKKSGIVEVYQEMVKSKKLTGSKLFEDLLRKRRIRTMSGVSVVSVMTRPMGCPGKCIYCPNQANMPKSYLDNQPAAMRGVMNDFDPYLQVDARLSMLSKMGHDVSKNEVIVLGGTFGAHPVRYQEIFIKRLFDAFNNYECRGGVSPPNTTSVFPNNIADNLSQAKKINEIASARMIGLTIETRPDYVNPEEIKWLRYLGVTRVELGVQSVFDEVLSGVKRGHNIGQVKEATRLLRQAGFKVVYHIMPGLPGSNIEKDTKMFEELFSDPGLCPDHLKIYPTVVLHDSELYDIWKVGDYKPYNETELIKFFKKIKPNIPPWVRIVRVMRDIPEESIVDGAKSSNLRQLIQASGVKCSCIRCREPRGEFIKDAQFVQREYNVWGGREVFLSYENQDSSKILALCRLFLPDTGENEVSKVIGEVNDCALIRELHTYGVVVGINQGERNVSQHRGLGKKLMNRAEKLAKKAGYKKMAVIAGIGVREYYRKIGYNLRGEYMVKGLV